MTTYQHTLDHKKAPEVARWHALEDGTDIHHFNVDNRQTSLVMSVVPSWDHKVIDVSFIATANSNHYSISKKRTQNVCIGFKWSTDHDTIMMPWDNSPRREFWLLDFKILVELRGTTGIKVTVTWVGDPTHHHPIH